MYLYKLIFPTASDYTICVQNLPQKFGSSEDIDEKIRKFFEELYCDSVGRKYQVTQVVNSYNIREYMQELKKEKELVKNFKRSSIAGNKPDPQKQKELKDLREQINAQEHKFSQGDV